MTVNSAAEKLFLKKGGGFYECTILTEHALKRHIWLKETAGHDQFTSSTKRNNFHTKDALDLVPRERVMNKLVQTANLLH